MMVDPEREREPFHFCPCITVYIHRFCVTEVRESSRAHQPYLQNDLGGFRLAHGAITVIGRTCVHAHSVVIGCCYKNGTLGVHYPTW